jgi:hypothetical protein
MVNKKNDNPDAAITAIEEQVRGTARGGFKARSAIDTRWKQQRGEVMSVTLVIQGTLDSAKELTEKLDRTLSEHPDFTIELANRKGSQTTHTAAALSVSQPSFNPQTGDFKALIRTKSLAHSYMVESGDRTLTAERVEAALRAAGLATEKDHFTDIPTPAKAPGKGRG